MQMFVEKPSQEGASDDGAWNNKAQTRVERDLRPDALAIWFLWERHSHHLTEKKIVRYAIIRKRHGPSFAWPAVSGISQRAEPIPGLAAIGATPKAFIAYINSKSPEFRPSGSRGIHDNWEN